MKIYSNEKRIASRAKWGRRTSMAGLIILMLGMLASLSPGYLINQPDDQWLKASALGDFLLRGGWVYVSMSALLFGFILGQIGNSSMRQFQKSPRPDQVVSRALKGFDDRNHLYAWATPGDLVFAGPAGIFVFITRDLAGKLNVIDGKVKQSFSLRRFFAFGQEAPGLPVAEAQDAADKVSEWLTQAVGGEEPVPVKPIVVFTNDKAELEVESAAAPVIHHKQLKNHLRNELRNNRISRSVLQKAVAQLDEEAARRGAEVE